MFKKRLIYIVLPTIISISLTACLLERREVSKEIKKTTEDLKYLNHLRKINKSKKEEKAVNNTENEAIVKAIQAVEKAESTQLQTVFELPQYLKNCSIDEMNVLANELIRVTILAIRSHCDDMPKVRRLASSIHNLPTFIGHFTSTKENDKWYSLEQYYKEFIHACFVLVEVDMAGYFGSHIRGAKFYDSWNEKGYINQIKDLIPKNKLS